MSEPLACALPATEAERRARMTRGAVAARVLRRERVDGGLRLAFPPDEETSARVREVVDAESRCCPFLDLAIERRGGELELTVTGPPEAGEIIDALFA